MDASFVCFCTYDKIQFRKFTIWSSRSKATKLTQCLLELCKALKVTLVKTMNWVKLEDGKQVESQIPCYVTLKSRLCKDGSPLKQFHGTTTFNSTCHDINETEQYSDTIDQISKMILSSNTITIQFSFDCSIQELIKCVRKEVNTARYSY